MKHVTRKFIATSFASIGLAAPAIAFDSGPSEVEIDSIAYGGSGCPAGTVAENLSDDFQAVTLLFDNYLAEIGPYVSRKDSRKNCQINIDLKFPQGWSYTLFSVDYRGYVSLDRGVTAEQKSTYYFQGDRSSASLNSIFYGPVDKDYTIMDTLGLSAEIWSPCGDNRSLNINSQVRLSTRSQNATGIITTDSIDGSLTHVYGIKWKRCY